MSTITNMPGWKERLPKIENNENNLSVKNWNFLDCRDENINTNANTNTINENNGRKFCPSKKFKKQNTCLEQLEKEIQNHPLALYPHYEESMPADIFEDVMAILDPEMAKARYDLLYVDPEPHDDFTDEFIFYPKDYGLPDNPKYIDPEEIELEKKRALLNKIMGLRGSPTTVSSNPYKSILKMDNQKNKKKNIQEKPTVLPLEDVSTPITDEFCTWFNGLSTDEILVSPESIGEFFKSGYNKKPALKIPLEELHSANIPEDLKEAKLTKAKASVDNKTKKLCDENAKSKFKYGSWYLHPSRWKKLESELVNDKTKSDKNDELSEEQIEQLILDQELSTLQSSKLFQNYLETRKARMPEFLHRVVQIQQERDQQEALQAQLALQKKAKKKTIPMNKKELS